MHYHYFTKHTKINYCIILHLSIYIALLIARAFQKLSRLKHWYCVGANMPKRYRQLRVKNLPYVKTTVAFLGLSSILGI